MSIAPQCPLIDWTSLQWREYEKLVLTPSFELVVTSTVSLAHGARAFGRFYESFVTRYGHGLTTYTTGAMTSWGKVKPRALQMVPGWLSEPENFSKGTEFYFTVHSGPSVTEMVPPALELAFVDGATYFALHLLPESIPNGSAALDFVQSALGDDFPLAAGWANYAICWNTAMGPLQGDPRVKLGAWVKRYPGLGHGNNFATSDRAFKGIANASWLTLIGPELVASKGGREAIVSALGPEITAHSMGKGGLGIQAGPDPAIGDVNRDDNLPLVHRVGAFLRDVRTHEPPRFLAGFDNNPEGSEEWFARFDA